MTRRARGAMPGRLEASISVLNGVVGDYLRRRANGLEIVMSLYCRNEPLPCEPAAIAAACAAPTSKLCVLVHGLAANEAVWSFPRERDVSYGSLLAADLGYTPFHVRYNTGLHVSENGRSLSHLIEALVRSYPLDVREIVLVGHSMGGLVVRSACEAARAERLGWLTQVRHAFYVGSPHLGAPAEKLGNVVAWILRAIGVAHTELVADVIDLRSAGIKDLRYASVVAADWEGYDPDALLENRCTVVPLAPGVSHHFGAGALGKRDADVLSSLLGDAMVRVASASYAAAHLPHTGSERRDVKVFPGVHHVALAHDRRVYDWIRSCCESGDGEATT